MNGTVDCLRAELSSFDWRLVQGSVVHTLFILNNYKTFRPNLIQRLLVHHYV